MTRHYSALSLFKEGIAGQTGWEKAWRSPEPKPRYDAIIIGGGGHGLATAYYLAKNHGVTNVALLEKGWIGGGNTGRNTTVVRSNYFCPESAAIYGLAHSLYKTLSKDLNYNVMFSARGILTLAHSEAGMETAARSVNAIRVNGIDCELFSVEDVRRVVPIYNFGPDARYPVYGGTWQPSGGTARHDAVAWGYARAASRLGVDIIQNCEITDFIIENGRCRGVVTSRGAIRAERTGMAVAGHSSVLAAKAGFRLPINSYALQACVSEPVKPILDTVVISPDTGVYVSQSDKGELVIGGALDRIPSYAQRGNLPVLEGVIAGMLDMYPIFGQLKMMRQWAGIVDVVPDSSPIIGESPLPGLFLNCGWGTGGFKAIPAGGTLLAHLLATGTHHDISRPFDLDRFARGRLIDEAAGSGIAH
ncbi:MULTISPECIES: sarcosine oxidase subunit beta family protein [unclassified Mesorhizobium]|uniref:sarcosine oxidase subunit beta family protein n=1 Tax=unclassified Mesorhizobium TaxID=325217 RepID=UPI000F7548FF|nr:MULTISPECIES: sarcosine oxidase subunit beta family protein [unclassified Mesorhizobium]AZO21816.1 sarcosine oxidase subunit beta family protein [Mesorhizobium sp. M1E.F.Ca.ET.045.02.1.1]RUW31196.1 sarcosine oxidase subunit beta family protein [Mesorhizobium sp. M1E.F.Ca.ET.041.01.1.1]RUW77201.1 sarcosine oxidase subunit beta family protein [Mesorhizobium sp. M1E.F.Ca.ET.063.01.1.1]RWB61404.1 MAG: sarcosine oxidase subunit beta family protein [Mesorhizobium sp.]RWD90326.1 MAG: sarcosine oxi